MTADAVTTNPPSAKQASRRAVLSATMGALAATLAGALGRAAPVRADDTDPILIGGSNLGTSRTSLVNATAGDTTFEADANGSGIGLFGRSVSFFGVYGFSPSGQGVGGASMSNNGVWGTSDQANGVFGKSIDADASGVYGENLSQGHGIAGRSNSGPLVNGLGAAASLGHNTSNGIGVWGRSATGIGMFAEAINASAVAFKAQGVAQFNRSGMATIGSGKAAVTIANIRIDPASLVLATLQQDRSGVHVRSAVPNAAGDSFTIRLNKAVGSATKVGWFIVN